MATSAHLEGATPPTNSVHDRLVVAIEDAIGHRIGRDAEHGLRAIPETDPNGLTRVLAAIIPGRVVLTGTVERRILFAERPSSISGWIIADLSGQPHSSRAWPQWARGQILVAEPSAWLSAAELTGDAVRRLMRPQVLLAALYHPEWFPLPRFAQGISDLARAVRETMLGQVTLMDMQLGVSLEDIEAAVAELHPDIVRGVRDVRAA